MVTTVLQIIDTTSESSMVRDLNVLDARVNAIVKDAKIKVVEVSPMIEVKGDALYVGMVVEWDMVPR